MLNKQNKQKVKSIFLGRKVKKSWCLLNSNNTKPILEEYTKTLERVQVLKKKMDFEFDVNEEVYLDELGVYTKIQKKTRDTNGNIIYNITYVAEVIEDFDEKIKKQYEKELAEWESKDKQREEENEKRLEKERLKIEAKNRRYEEFKAKKDKVKKKNTIIFEIPKSDKRYKTRTLKDIKQDIEMNLPMDYNVVITSLKVSMYDGDNKIIVSNDVKKLLD